MRKFTNHQSSQPMSDMLIATSGRNLRSGSAYGLWFVKTEPYQMGD